jgi:hypothetical protein
VVAARASAASTSARFARMLCVVFRAMSRPPSFVMPEVVGKGMRDGV